MVYRRRYRNVRSVSDDELRSFIDEHLGKTRLKEESVSFLVQTVRDAGLHVPTRHGEAEDAFERLGYGLRRDRNEYGSIMRTYVQQRSNDEEGEGLDRKEKVRLVTVRFEDVTCTKPGEACEWPECACPTNV